MRQAQPAIAAPGARVVILDGERFTELYRDGHLCGLARVCSHHNNCKRHLEGLPMDETRARLLRREAAGAEASREQHLRMARSRLLRAFRH